MHSSVVESGGSGEEFERVGVGGAHDPEIAFVERRDDGQVQAFSRGDGGRVDDVEAGIGVDGDEFVNPGPVIGGEIDDGDLASRDCSEEPLLGSGPGPIEEQPRGLRDHGNR